MSARAVALVAAGLALASCRSPRLQVAEPRTDPPLARLVPPEVRRPVAVVWDPAISPPIDCNPVRTQHTFAVTVLDQCGCPMPGQRVEWILARHPQAVGDLVATDDQPTGPVAGGLGKVDNAYAVTVTNEGEEVLDAASRFPSTAPDGSRRPDFVVGRGQSWITITSVAEGVTDVVAYVPGIRDATRHKIFAKKVWADYAVLFPEDTTALLPDDARAFTVSVRRASDGGGIAGATVEAEVLDGPEAAFEGGGRTATATTGADGLATFTLRNGAGLPGTNRLRFAARARYGQADCLREQVVSATWRRVTLECRCAVSAASPTEGDPVDAVLTVANTGDASAGEVTLALAVPPGLAVVDGTSFPLSLGVVGPGESVQRVVRLAARAEGRQELAVAATAAAGSASSRCACSVEVLRGRLELACRCEPASVDVGYAIRFVATVRNGGRGVLRGTTVRLDWPAGTTARTQGSAEVPFLAPGAEEEIAFEGVPTAPGPVRATARASAEGFPEATSVCEGRATQCALAVVLEAPAAVGLGDAARVVARVTNRGDGVARDGSLRVAHEAGLGGRTTVQALPEIAPGATHVVEWTAPGAAVGPSKVVVDAEAEGCAARAEAAVRVTGLVALQTEMSDQDLEGRHQGIFLVGEEYLYVLRVDNDQGTESSEELRVSFSLPKELALVSAAADRDVGMAPAAGGAASGPFRLAPDEAVTFRVRVKAVAVPPDHWVKVAASVTRAADGAELARETESTTVKK